MLLSIEYSSTQKSQHTKDATSTEAYEKLLECLSLQFMYTLYFDVLCKYL